MVNTPPSNLLQGIYLAQYGNRAEALRYLRHAARTEPITAEGWLWLAAVTDDLEEYRHCVNQALREQPDHPTALRMRADLEQRRAAITGTGQAAVDVAGRVRVRPSRGRRLLRWVVVLLVIGGCIGAVAALVMSGVVQDQLDEWFRSGGDRATITLGESPTYRFEVDLPASWIAADENSETWLTKRDELREAFPDSNVWDQIDVSFSAVERDPVYGVMAPSARLVETAPERIEQDGMVAALTLQEIVPLPDDPDDPDAAVCDRMRLLEQQFEDEGRLESGDNNELIEASIARRESLDDCVFYIHRRYTQQEPHQVVFPLTNEQAPDATRSILIAIPVEGERYAVWILTIADSAYDDYEGPINTIIGSLNFVS